MTWPLFFFGEEMLDRLEHLLVAGGALPAELAGPEGAHVAAAVENVNAGPHAVAPGVPVGFVVIDEYREGKPLGLQLVLERFDVVLTVGFRRVDADESRVLAGELLLPLAIGRIIVNTVAAAEG